MTPTAIDNRPAIRGIFEATRRRWDYWRDSCGSNRCQTLGQVGQAAHGGAESVFRQRDNRFGVHRSRSRHRERGQGMQGL